MKNILLLIAIVFLAMSCVKQKNDSTTEAEIKKLKEEIELSKPGLGEIMGTIQQHHAKLYFSAINKNWKLSEYELSEIKEGIEEATGLYDHFKEVKISLKQMSGVTEEPLKMIEKSIQEKNLSEFKKAYSSLNKSCNECHSAAEHDFIVIQEPTNSEFTNQNFKPNH